MDAHEQPTPEEAARWNEKTRVVVETWIDEMQKSGRDGKAILDALGADGF